MSNSLRINNTIADGHPDRFARGVFAGYDLPDAMKEFIGMPIERALSSSNPLIRGLAVLDHRVGERTLEKIDEENEPPLVARLVAVRRSIRKAKTVGLPPNP
jgi:hypothetical protein